MARPSWVTYGPCGWPQGDVLFHWEISRAATCLEKIIPADFRGTLQCDGYQADDCFAKGRAGQIVLAGCLAHMRRKFFDAKETAPKVAGWFLQHFRHLYELEAQLRNTRAGPKLRQARRAGLSRPVLARMHRALMRLKTKRRFLPQSGMGKALDYALNQWPSLHVFLKDGRVEIDNNLVENAIRPTAIGKKNWLFIGDAGAGQRSAIILDHDRKLSRARPRPLRLPARSVHAATHDDQLAGQRPHARSLGEDAAVRRWKRSGTRGGVGVVSRRDTSWMTGQDEAVSRGARADAYVEGPQRFVPALCVIAPPGSFDCAAPAFPPPFRTG